MHFTLAPRCPVLQCKIAHVDYRVKTSPADHGDFLSGPLADRGLRFDSSASPIATTLLFEIPLGDDLVDRAIAAKLREGSVDHLQQVRIGLAHADADIAGELRFVGGHEARAQ